MEVGESKSGIGLQDKQDYGLSSRRLTLFQRYVNLDAQEQWIGLA